MGLEKITWKEFLSLLPYQEVYNWAKWNYQLEPDDLLTEEILEGTRIFGEGNLPDWILHKAAMKLDRTGKQRFNLAKQIKDDKTKYYAACDVPNLTRSQRFELVKNIQKEAFVYFAARDVPGLSADKRFELLNKIKNERTRYTIACLFLDLTVNQRYKLVRNVKDENIRLLASYYVPDLTEKQREKLRK